MGLNFGLPGSWVYTVEFSSNSVNLLLSHSQKRLRRYPIILLELDIKLTLRVAKRTVYRQPTLGNMTDLLLLEGLSILRLYRVKKEIIPL